MKKLDKILMIAEITIGFVLLILAIVEDSWIVGWCSTVSIMSGFFIGINSEMGEVWSMMKFQNDVHMKLLEDIVDLCKDLREEQGSSSGSSEVS